MQPLSDALLERLKNRQAVLVAGLGCSELAALPTWRPIALALAERVADEAEKQAIVNLVESGQLAAAVAILRTSLASDVVAETLQGLFPARAEVPDAIQAVAKAPWRGLITTGLDSLWTAALANAADLAGRVVCAAEAASLESGRGRFLLQVFGRPDLPSSLCLAPSDLGPTVVDTGAARFIEGLHKRWSFVFVGFSAGDPDLALLAGRVLASSPSTLEHFFVAPDLSTIDARRVKAEYGLTGVAVEGSLADALHALTSACALAGDKPTVDDVEAWLGRLTAEPDDQEARGMLDQGLSKLRENHEWERLVAALVSRAEIEPKAAAQAAHLCQAARVLEQELAAADRAYPVAVMALHLTPTDASLLDDTKRIAEKAGQSKELLEELRHIEEQAPISPELTALSLSVAGMLAGAPDRQDEAIAVYQKVIDREATNQAALDSLETLLRKAERWERLGELYRQALQRAPEDSATQAKLEEVYQRTHKVPELIELLQARLAQEPDGAELLDQIEDLCRKNEQWRPLTTLLERRAERAEPAAARAMRLERATLLVDKLKDVDGALAVARGLAANDPSAAEEIYGKCLDGDPGNAAALLALADLARDKGDHLRAAKFILDATARTQNPLELGRLFTEAGSIYLDGLADPDKAADLFQRALDADPEQTAAAGRLLALREQKQDWGGAEPLLDLLVRKAPEEGKSELYQRQAHNARKLGKTDKAAAAIEAASKIDRGSPRLAQEHAEHLFERQAWAEARSEYQRARDLWGGKAPAPVELCERLGACSVHLGDTEAALDYYEEALALEPGKASTLEALIDLRTSGEAWKEAVELRRKLLALRRDDADRARILEDIGDVQHGKLNDWPSAVASYREALLAQPERRQLLYKLLDCHTQEKQWTEALETLHKLASLESEPTGRAKLSYAMAAIYRDELQDSSKAIELFAKVLDDSPLYPKAFEAIEKVLGEAKDWKELERAYRKQIKRLPDDVPSEIKLRLWDALAEVALKLHDKDSAAVTLAAAVALDGGNLARRERLANLYFSMGPSAADKAIAQHQALLAKQPDRIDSYKALAALFFQAGAHDKTWCVAGAMTCLDKADPPLRALYENFRPTQAPSGADNLSEDLWRRIVHPDEEQTLSAILALAFPALAMPSAQPHKSLGLDKSARVDLTGEGWRYAGALRYVASAIGAPLPEVYLKRDAPGTVTLVNLKEKSVLVPAIVVGLGFEQLSSQSQVVFDLAKRMVQLRPGRFPRLPMATPGALDTAARAALQLGGVVTEPGDHPDDVRKMAKQLDGALPKNARAELKTLAKKYVETCGNQVDVTKWMIAADLTAARAALAICGDIGAAARVLAMESSTQSPMPVAERVHDLLAYFVSDDHFAVRERLGLQVNLTAPTDPAPPSTRWGSHTQLRTQG